MRNMQVERGWGVFLRGWTLDFLATLPGVVLTVMNSHAKPDLEIYRLTRDNGPRSASFGFPFSAKVRFKRFSFRV